MEKQVVVMGQGYVGLPLALEAARVGHNVVGFDVSRALVEALMSGRSHVDDIKDIEIEEALSLGYRATTDATVLESADVIVVCVPTPLSEAGGPDLGAVQSAGRLIGSRVRRDALVILESTTYPGTTEEVFAPLVLTDRFSREEVRIAFSPERIDPGNKHYGVRNTPKVVGGLTPRATMEARDFYGGFIDVVVEAKGAKEAEMAKLLENTFRHVNIALVNEMLRFSNELDIDLWDAIDCAATKPFGFMPFRPGPGVGGHCIPVDPSYLSHRVRAQLGYAFRMVELAEEINTAAPLYVANRMWRLLNAKRLPMNGSSILLVGVTYKPDIADQRESPADPLAAKLTELGASISYHDPHVPKWCPEEARLHLVSVEDVYEAASRADAVVILQPHASYDLARLSDVSRLLLDTRGVLPEAESVHRL